MNADRITEHLDWQDGINAFRLKMIEEVKKINDKLNKLEQQTKEKTP